MWKSALFSAGTRLILPVVVCMIFFFSLCSVLVAQSVSACKGSPELEGYLSSHSSAAAYDALGRYFANKGQISCAVSAFKSAVRVQQNAWQGHYNLALALNSIGKPTLAYREMEAAKRLNPADPQVHLGLGLILSQLNRTDDAIEEFRLVLKSQPDSIQALDGIAKALIAEKRYSAAIASLSNAPVDRGLQLDLAIAYSRNGEPAKASRLLEALVKANPQNAKAHLNLGLTYTHQAEYHKAAKEFHRALQIDPTSKLARISYVKTLIILKQYQAALPVIKDYLCKRPNDFDALELGGEIESGLADYAAAKAMLDRAIAIDSNQYNARYFLGFVLAKLGKPTEARIQLEKALQLDPGSSEALFQLAGVLRSLGQEDQARKELQAFQRQKQEAVQQDMASTKVAEANQSLQAGDVVKAIETYRQAIMQDPEDYRIYYDLALALHRQKKYVAERDALAKTIQLNPKFAEAHDQIGVLDLQVDKVQAAKNDFKTAIALNPQYAEAESNLGVVEGHLGQTVQAERLFRRATEDDPQYVDAFVNLGLILASESRFSDAEKVLQHAIQLDPSNTRARTASAMVLAQLGHGTGSIK